MVLGMKDIVEGSEESEKREDGVREMNGRRESKGTWSKA